MGCAQSKTVEIDGVKVQEKPKRVSKKVAHPSDIDNEHTALTSGLIHRANVSQMHEKYDTSKAAELGRGACGSVVAVRRKDTNDMFAMKTVTLESMGCANFDELLVELNVQKRLDHPNIARIIESFEDERHGVMYIVMELCAGGSLVSRMRKHRHGYTERMAATIIEKTLSAIVYCHHHGVVHRDIKLDNIMYEKDSDDGELKLIDFGFAMEVKRGAVSMWDQLGTPSYMAPELWQVRERHRASRLLLLLLPRPPHTSSKKIAHQRARTAITKCHAFAAFHTGQGVRREGRYLRDRRPRLLPTLRAAAVRPPKPRREEADDHPRPAAVPVADVGQDLEGGEGVHRGHDEEEERREDERERGDQAPVD